MSMNFVEVLHASGLGAKQKRRRSVMETSSSARESDNDRTGANDHDNGPNITCERSLTSAADPLSQALASRPLQCSPSASSNAPSRKQSSALASTPLDYANVVESEPPSARVFRRLVKLSQRVSPTALRGGALEPFGIARKLSLDVVVRAKGGKPTTTYFDGVQIGGLGAKPRRRVVPRVGDDNSSAQMDTNEEESLLGKERERPAVFLAESPMQESATKVNKMKRPRSTVSAPCAASSFPGLAQNECEGPGRTARAGPRKNVRARAKALGLSPMQPPNEPAPAAKAKEKKKDAALDAFKRLPHCARIQSFWSFVIQAVKGVTSNDPLCRDYALGGLLPFIGDVNTVAKEVLIPCRRDLGEQLWRVLVVVWLGAGGPGFRTFRHITSEARLCGQVCPLEARLPELNAEEDVLVMYEHIAKMSSTYGRDAVFSGDGQAVKFRLSSTQGIDVLRAWRRCAQDLYTKSCGTRAGLEQLGAKSIARFLKAVPFMGSLAIKEVFCYLYLAHPIAFDVDDYVPVGSGAAVGGRAVLGIPEKARVDWHAQFLEMAQGIPATLKSNLAEAIQERTKQCDLVSQPGVPGVRQQLQDARVTAGDIEVCMCLFMNYLRAKHRGCVPRGWHMLKRSHWDSTLDLA